MFVAEIQAGVTMLSKRMALKSKLSDPRTWKHNVEIASVLLLSFATILTAWSAYQATRWSGVQSRAYKDVSIHRIDSGREFTRAAQQYSLDGILFAQLVEAYASDDQELVAFYRERVMRETFVPILDAWIATDPLNNENAPRNPLYDEAYRQQLLAASLALEAQAESRYLDASEAHENVDSYVLTTVAFAVVFFFAGTSPKFESVRLQRILLSMASIVLLTSLIYIARLPVQ
jgi:hypothetical protein